jgi:drug/metabolite transporter (DMT)-like permease
MSAPLRNKVIAIVMSLLGAALVALGIIHDEPAAITIGVAVAATASVPMSASMRRRPRGRGHDDGSSH